MNRLNSALLVFVIAGAGCDGESPSTSKITIEDECLQLLADGRFYDGVELARERRFHALALSLLTQLEVELDYDKSCTISAMLSHLTEVDIMAGISVPEEYHAVYAADRLRYWKTWIFSREGRAFLEGAASRWRPLWSDELVDAFLIEMLK